MITKFPILFWLLIIFITVFEASCKSSQVPLSKEEEKFADSLAQEYKCEVVMQHDRTAIKEDKKSGIFTINIKNDQTNICIKDSLTLIKISKDISSKLKGIISHQQNYMSINTSFTTTKRTSENSFQTLCDKEVITDIKNGNLIAFKINFHEATMQ